MDSVQASFLPRAYKSGTMSPQEDFTDFKAVIFEEMETCEYSVVHLSSDGCGVCFGAGEVGIILTSLETHGGTALVPWYEVRQCMLATHFY